MKKITTTILFLIILLFLGCQKNAKSESNRDVYMIFLEGEGFQSYYALSYQKPIHKGTLYLPEEMDAFLKVIKKKIRLPFKVYGREKSERKLKFSTSFEISKKEKFKVMNLKNKAVKTFLSEEEALSEVFLQVHNEMQMLTEKK